MKIGGNGDIEEGWGRAESTRQRAGKPPATTGHPWGETPLPLVGLSGIVRNQGKRSNMPSYIIKWNYGYGDEYDEVEADNEEAAQNIAYERWREDAESQAIYDVVGEATDELREEYL